jgi:hypothetical protein
VPGSCLARVRHVDGFAVFLARGHPRRTRLAADADESTADVVTLRACPLFIEGSSPLVELAAPLAGEVHADVVHLRFDAFLRRECSMSTSELREQNYAPQLHAAQ